MKTVFSIIAVLACAMAIIWINMTIWDECRETHSFYIALPRWENNVR